MFVGTVRTFTAGAALSSKRLVKLSATKVVHNTAAAADDPIGVADYGVADTEPVAVRPLNCGGTLEMTAAGAIAADAAVYAAADGKVQSLPAAPGTYRQIGIAIEAATADNDIIEVMPYNYGATKTVV